MTSKQKTERLRSMMRTYEGPRHTVVAFTLGDGKPEYISAGTRPSDAAIEDVIFEIGSITKVFTGILLCVLVEEGKVDPQAPLREMADELVDVPDWITPESLTSHTSGLPNIYMPIWKALLQQKPEGPYADFSRADLRAWLHDRRGRAMGPKRRHAYSNIGVGLLGEAMAMAEGKPFVELLAEKVISPLGLKDTGDGLDDGQQRRFAQPRHPRGRPVSAWSFRALAGAGYLRSSARDLARFSDRVIKALNAPETTLDRAIRRSAVPLFGLGPKGGMEPAAQCSGWISMKLDRAEPRFIYHDGATAGSTCAVYICPERAKACGVVSNNGIAANLWAGTKLSWSNQLRQAQGYFAAT